MASLQVFLGSFFGLIQASDAGTNRHQPRLEIHNSMDPLNMVVHEVLVDPLLELVGILQHLGLAEDCGHMAEGSILPVMGMADTALAQDRRSHIASAHHHPEKLQKTVVLGLSSGIVGDTPKVHWQIHTTVNQSLCDHLPKKPQRFDLNQSVS